MTAQTVRQPELVPDVEAAREHVARAALLPDMRGRVGLELEFHLVDLALPARRPAWDEVQRVLADLPPMPCGSRLSVEPGGQLELSTPPAADASTAVAVLRNDSAALRGALAPLGYGAAALGADPARRAERVNPHPRYAAMEHHFAALGHGRAGAAMMNATAALQVNIDAGAPSQWRRRTTLLRRLTPVLIAVSASSGWLGGRTSGWRSMRQEAWQGLDPSCSGPIPAGEPTAAWAEQALAAPVMLTQQGSGLVPVLERLSFGEWIARPGRLGRAPGFSDLDYHLSTLFPPVRPRGYLEVRCLDALPEEWWPAIVGFVVTLVDDPTAADLAAELCLPVEADLARAAQLGLGSPSLAQAAARLAAVAASRCAPPLRDEVERLADLLADGRAPGDDVLRRIEAVGPLRVLEEEARA